MLSQEAMDYYTMGKGNYDAETLYMIAQRINGIFWHSGGGIFLVTKNIKQGYLVIGDEGLGLYKSEKSFDNADQPMHSIEFNVRNPRTLAKTDNEYINRLAKLTCGYIEYPYLVCWDSTDGFACWDNEQICLYSSVLDFNRCNDPIVSISLK